MSRNRIDKMSPLRKHPKNLYDIFGIRFGVNSQTPKYFYRKATIYVALSSLRKLSAHLICFTTVSSKRQLII